MYCAESLALTQQSHNGFYRHIKQRSWKHPDLNNEGRQDSGNKARAKGDSHPCWTTHWVTHVHDHQNAQVGNDVLMLPFLFPDAFSRQVVEANYRYYEPITDHGSSLSPCVHAAIAARIGYNADAERYWENALYLDLLNLMCNTSLGIHLGSIGGVWQALVFHMLGIRLIIIVTTKVWAKVGAKVGAKENGLADLRTNGLANALVNGRSIPNVS